MGSVHKNAEKILKSMMNKYTWIETEKEAFGVRGGDYDFVETNPAEMSRHLKDLQAEQTSLVCLHMNLHHLISSFAVLC
jgi:hypothetical protein